MITSQKHELRASEIRQRLNAIARMDELSDDLRAESDKLTAEYADVETRKRAALVAECSPRIGRRSAARVQQRTGQSPRASRRPYVRARLPTAAW